MLQEQQFYRRYGMRLPQQLVNPRISSTDFLEFPKNSIYHFTEVDNVIRGPRNDEFYFRNINGKIPIKHIVGLSAQNGNVRRLGLQVMPLIREFQNKHRRYMWLRDGMPFPTNENKLCVINYAMCSHVYKYVKSAYGDYWYNLNIISTFFHQMGKAAETSGRHQYIVLHLPKQLPSITRLNTFVNKTPTSINRFFYDRNASVILELWKWCDPETRKDSALNYIDPKFYHLTNLIFEESGSWFMFNLGVLDSWIYSENRNPKHEATVAAESFNIKETIDFAKIPFLFEDFKEDNYATENFDQKIKIAPIQVRKRLLRSLMTLMETRTIESAADEVDEDGNTVEPNILQSDKEIIEGQSDEDSESVAEIKLKKLDEDLSQLELLEKEQETQDAIAEIKAQEKQAVVIDDSPIDIEDFNIKKDPHVTIKETIDKLANDGNLSGAEYRKLNNINDKAQELESPTPGVKMKDYIKVTDEELKVKATVFTDRVTIIDKEQLKSSLQDFDKNYITKTLKKETIAMALATQKAGFVINEYKVESFENELGGYETHSFKCNPVIGKASTLYFRVPKIDPSGEFKVGGNNYRMRKQRSDLPIRKISDDRVQLSSYYGKVFVSRSDKKVDDYGSWLTREIQIKYVEEPDFITDMKPGDVFDNLSKTPMAFSSISKNFREIACQGFLMNFDVKVCRKQFTDEMFDSFARKGFILFGDNGKGVYLAMDNLNNIHKTDGKIEPEFFGTVEEFFGLTEKAANAPINFTECRVFGQGIPTGIILGYYYGLEELMKMLKVSPRRVPSSSRINLQPHEWVISFRDESLVFDKDDRLATLILAGFNSFAKVIKGYSVYNFDSKGVYLNVLESKKITTRYIRELDLLDDLFIDPITESLLVEMKEPTTYRALLMRSSELLLEDYYPNPLDMDYQTIRGYERVAGAVYSEMVLSIREQRKSLGRANTQISLKPHAVWKRITSDPANKITVDINPINNLKEMEAVTFNGVGGRSSRTMNAASRVYDKSDMGVISEATSDSADVAINTYTVSNPSFESVRGKTFRRDEKDLTATTLLSTSASLATGSDTDD